MGYSMRLELTHICSLYIYVAEPISASAPQITLRVICVRVVSAKVNEGNKEAR